MAKKKAAATTKASDPLQDEFRQVLAENGVPEDTINETILFPLYLKYPNFPKAIKLIAAVYGESNGTKRVVLNDGALEPAFVCLLCYIVGLRDYRITDWKRRLKGVSPPELVLLAVHGAKETLEKRVE
ncbi:MAG: hypothetical protein P4L84_34205 [Isosphaeraceae bacterium]|nr:hypothetical protein [Isosphaeraceae bacterium]